MLRLIPAVLIMLLVSAGIASAAIALPKGPKSQREFKTVQAAAVKGKPDAAFRLAGWYYHGTGVVKDAGMAAFWLRKSASAGNADAQCAYAELLLAGDGVAENRSEAVEWLQKSAQQGNAQAKKLLHELLTYRGAVPGEIRSPAQHGAPYLETKPRTEDSIRLEGKGVLLDQGTFGLKFSLPSMNDPYAPLSAQKPEGVYQMLEKLQGGTFDIIIRPPQK